MYVRFVDFPGHFRFVFKNRGERSNSMICFKFGERKNIDGLRSSRAAVLNPNCSATRIFEKKKFHDHTWDFFANLSEISYSK